MRAAAGAALRPVLSERTVFPRHRSYRSVPGAGSSRFRCANRRRKRATPAAPELRRLSHTRRLSHSRSPAARRMAVSLRAIGRRTGRRNLVAGRKGRRDAPTAFDTVGAMGAALPHSGHRLRQFAVRRLRLGNRAIRPRLRRHPSRLGGLRPAWRSRRFRGTDRRARPGDFRRQCDRPPGRRLEHAGLDAAAVRMRLAVVQ